MMGMRLANAFTSSVRHRSHMSSGEMPDSVVGLIRHCRREVLLVDGGDGVREYLKGPLAMALGNAMSRNNQVPGSIVQDAQSPIEHANGPPRAHSLLPQLRIEGHLLELHDAA